MSTIQPSGTTSPLELKALLYRGRDILKDLKNASDAGARASYRWAAQAYKEACEAFPEHPYPLYRQAHSLFYSHYKDAQKIRSLLDRACAADKGNPLLMLAAGWIYKNLDASDYRGRVAWKIYQEQGWGASLAPEYACWDIEGVKFPLVDNAEQALEAHRGFVAAFPAAGDAFNPIGEILAESVSVVEARRVWNSGIQADPLALRCHISLALLQPDAQAVASLNHAEELLHLKGRQHPALISLYEWRAFLLERLGQPEAAIVDMQRCPGTLQNRLRLVALYAHIGRYDVALAMYDQILIQMGQEKPEQPERILREIHRGRGWIYSHRGEWAAAADALQQALALDPGNIVTAQDLGYARGRLDAQRRVKAEDDELLERFKLQSQDTVDILQRDLATRLNRLDRRIQRVRRDLLGNLKVVRRITVKLLASAKSPAEQEEAFALATERIHEMVESLVRERNMEYYSQQVSKSLPDLLTWEQLSASSKRSLAHAELLYRENIEMAQFDYTPVLVEICRVFEQEFFEQLLQPLAHYAEGYHVAAGEQCLRLALFDWDLSNPEFLSLGRIAALLDGLRRADVSPGLSLFVRGAWGEGFCASLDDIRQGVARMVELRNKAAQGARLDRPLIDAVRHLFFGGEGKDGLLSLLAKGYPVYPA